MPELFSLLQRKTPRKRTLIAFPATGEFLIVLSTFFEENYISSFVSFDLIRVPCYVDISENKSCDYSNPTTQCSRLARKEPIKIHVDSYVRFPFEVPLLKRNMHGSIFFFAHCCVFHMRDPPRVTAFLHGRRLRR